MGDDITSRNNREHTDIETRDGARWSSVSPGLGLMNGVSCADATTCMAVGEGNALAYLGT